MYPSYEDCISALPLDLDKLRNEVVIGTSYVPSSGKHFEVSKQFEMLEREFVGQLRLKLVHAQLNVLLRRNTMVRHVYSHFCELWSGHADILLDSLDSRWLISACDSICDHSADPGEATTAILISLFVNSLKLAETERLLSLPSKPDLSLIRGRTPVFDGMTAFMPGGGDMPRNLLLRLDKTLQPETLLGKIGRELINRVLSSDTVFSRFRKLQVRNIWNNYLSPHVASNRPIASEPRHLNLDLCKPGYIFLNDTSQLSTSFHIGTVYTCNAIRQNLNCRNLQEIGWANDRGRFDAIVAELATQPSLVVLNGEGTLHHGAARAFELLSICEHAKKLGSKVAVINTVWEGNPDLMVSMLHSADFIHVRDSISFAALPGSLSANVTPDVSIQLFMQAARDGQFLPPHHDIGVIDSVIPTSASALLDFAEHFRAPFFAMPAGSLRKARQSVAARSGVIWPQLMQLPDLMTCHAWVTGRFHGLVAALCLGRPVCALSSNTSKVEGLLRDADITDFCLLGKDWSSAPFEQQLSELVSRFEAQKSVTFIKRRDKFLQTATDQSRCMFDALAALAES